MELHEGETILFEGHPSWRAALLFFLKGFGIGVMIGAILWFAISEVAGVTALVVIAVITVLASVIVRSAIDYKITDERLHIRRGILSKRIHETRLGRVQDVTIEQSFPDRILRIGRAEFETASDEASNFVFEGIANPDQVRQAVDKAHRLAEHRAEAAPGGTTGGL